MVSESVAASSGTEASSTSKDVFHRLVRTISGRSVTNDLGPASPLPDVQQHQALERTQSGTSTSSHVPDKRNLSVGDKLWKLSQDLPLKLRRNSKSGLASPRVTTGELSTTTDPGRDPAFGQVGHARKLSTVVEQADANGGVLENAPSTSTDTPSPATLAQRLRDLIDPLPFPTFSSPVKHPKLAPRDKNGRPIAPPSASPVNDNRLIALLSSATFMNGSNIGDKHRPSIWGLLESLGAPPHGFPEPQSTGGGGPADREPRYAGTSSVMVYSPLIPGKDDIVELGELIPIAVEEEEDIQDNVAPMSWTSVWPLSLITGWTQSATQVGVTQASIRGGFSGDFYVHSDITSMDASGRRLRVKTTSAWVPSTTKMSFQVMWWGYRLWLPPPVMNILSDQTLEAAKRASLIATALAWFFNNLPINVLPVPVRPALLLMQRIVPYLGYIATFISWSWGTIKSYDVGHGVTLTATWLLPIALIPGSWFDRDVPKSPTQSPSVDIPNHPTPTTPTSPPTTSPSIPSQPPSEAPKSPPATSPPSTTPSQPPSNPPTQTPPSTQPAQPPVTPPPQPPVTVPIVPGPPMQQPTTPVTTPSNPAVPALGPVILDPTPFLSPKLFAKKLFSLSASKVTSIPVPPFPADLPPVPPVPTPRTPVHVGSSLGEVLLQAPALRPVPLPDEPAGSVEMSNKSDKGKKIRVKAFLGHRGN